MLRVVVIGAGLLGAAAADRLAARGVGVTVLEAGRPAAGASGRTFGWINAQDKEPAAYFQLNAAGVRAHRRLATELGGEWYHPGGDIAIARSDGIAALRTKIERCVAAGYRARELDGVGLRELEPELAVADDPPFLGAHFPDEAWIDPPGLIGRLLDRARSNGATVRTGARVEGFRDRDGWIEAVRLPSGEEVASDAVVLAAGVGSETLARSAGVALPMAPSPGLLVLVKPAEPVLGRVVHAGDVALRPDRGGRVMLASRSVDRGLDPTTGVVGRDEPVVRDLVARAAGLLPALEGAPVDETRVGVRSVAADGLPALGFTTAGPNLYLLVSHSGATLAPVLGELAAREVMGGEAPELAPFRPQRFG